VGPFQSHLLDHRHKLTARALGLPSLADVEDTISPWPLAYARGLAGVSPPCTTTAQMGRTKPSRFVHSFITSAGASLALPLPAGNVILTRTRKTYLVTEQTYTIPRAVSSEPQIGHNFLFQSSALVFLFNSCSALIQQKKSGTFKTQ